MSSSQKSQPAYPIRYLLVIWLFVLSAVAYLDRTNISIAGIQIGKEFAIDNTHLGWVFSAFLIGYAAFQVPAGLLVHKFGTRLVLSVAALWWGLFTVLTAVMPPRLCRCASQAQLCCHHSCARPLRTRRRRSNNVSGNQSIRRTLVSDARTRKSQRHHLRCSWCRIPNRDRNCRALRLAG